jgi:hypothetical protein
MTVATAAATTNGSITDHIGNNNINGNHPSSPRDGYQLWVRTKLDESPYPLIGHEIPLVIKLHWTRQAFNSRSQKSYDEYKAGCRCSFILRKVGQMTNFENAAVGSQKTKLKKVKSSIKLQNVFRRVSHGTKGADANADEKKGGGQLFGRPLDQICKNNSLPGACTVRNITKSLSSIYFLQIY